MRGHVDGLASPHDLGPSLPALYLDDSFAQRFISAFDDVLAPIHSSLDCLPAYLDPWLAPEDFVDWLSVWVGAVIDGTWDTERRRASVAHAAELYRLRGTSRGLAAQIELITGGAVEIVENGASAWSFNPAEPMPGSPEPSLVVRVTVDDPSSVDIGRLDLLVAEAKPAHVPHTIEVNGARGGTGTDGRGRAPRAAAEGRTPVRPAGGDGADAPAVGGDDAAGQATAGDGSAGQATAGDGSGEAARDSEPETG
jgi:phage tail-like protein